MAVRWRMSLGPEWTKPLTLGADPDKRIDPGVFLMFLNIVR